MTTLIWIAAVVIAVTLVAVLTHRYRRVTEARVITCPETGHREAVHVDPVHRASHAMFGKPDMRLQSCTRWPERQDCDQPCLQQIAEAPDGCRVRALLDRFYAGQSCVSCGHAVGAANDWVEHVPGLMRVDGAVVPWTDVPPQDLEAVLADAKPVCWNCTQVARVEQEHPELVTVRPGRKWEATS